MRLTRGQPLDVQLHERSELYQLMPKPLPIARRNYAPNELHEPAGAMPLG